MEEKYCRDCTYFVQYYKKRVIRYQKLYDVGHCTKKYGNNRFRNTDKPCEFYKERNLKEERGGQLKTAGVYLSEIAQEIKELKEILKNENLK